MGSGKPHREKPGRAKNPNKTKTKPKPPKFKRKKPTPGRPAHDATPSDDSGKRRNDKGKRNEKGSGGGGGEDQNDAVPQSPRDSFVREFQSANSLQLSSIELESIGDKSFVEVPEQVASEGEDAVNLLGKLVKGIFGSSWREALCEGRLIEGEIDAGSPAVVMVSTSAIRSIELLRGVRSMTKECHGVKLFSKHMKVDEQVASLKNRVNFVSGTPNRLKKLIDIEALGLSRLKLLVLDTYPDVKGYSLLTLPQVRDEFWDLYKTCFHQRLLQGDLQIYLFGPIPKGGEYRGKRKTSRD